MKRKNLLSNRSGSASLSLFGLGLLAFGGCTDLPDDAVTQEDAPLLLWSGATKWPDGVVNVCWTLTSTQRADFATKSQFVQDRVNDTWGRVANVRFVGWGTCTGNQGGIVKIDLADDDIGDAGGHGYPGSGGFRFMHLGVMHPGFGTGAMVPHEFGHILGFPHEMARADFTDDPANPANPEGDCNEANTTGDTLGTPANDRSSIMASSYCHFNPNLSRWDIVGVQNAYGRKTTGSLVGLHNRCVRFPGLTPPVGQNLEVWDCAFSANQIWRWASSDQLYSPALQAGTMQNEGGMGANQASLEVSWFDANNPPRQAFSFTDVTVRGIGETCVDVPAGTWNDGQPLRIFGCSFPTNQSWTAQANGTIRHGNFCWDVPGGNTATGTRIQIFTCHGGPNQQFSYTNNGQLMFGGKCLDVVGGTPTDGNQIQLFPCKSMTDPSRMNQLWHLTGPVRNQGRCLDIRGGASFNGAQMQIYDCGANAPNQTWDYYFNR